MACSKRENGGACTHHKCAYRDKSPHGNECVNVVGGYCEVGEGCVPECPHSWSKNDRVRRAGATKAFFDSGEPQGGFVGDPADYVRFMDQYGVPFLDRSPRPCVCCGVLTTNRYGFPDDPLGVPIREECYRSGKLRNWLDEHGFPGA